MFAGHKDLDMQRHPEGTSAGEPIYSQFEPVGCQSYLDCGLSDADGLWGGASRLKFF